MFKWIRRLAFVAIALLVLVAIAIGVVLMKINTIAKSGIEKGGTYALGVPTTLDSIDIAIFSGACDLNNLTIANPAGYHYDRFMKISSGEFALDTSTLRSDTIVVNKLHLTGVELSVEKTRDGANYQVILDNLQKTADALQSGQTKPAEPAAKPTGDETGFIIKDILIEDIAVNVNLDALGLGSTVKKTIHLKDPIHLTNVGSAKDAGAQMSTVIAKLVQTMLAEIIRQGGGLIPSEITDELGKGLDGIKAIGNIGTQLIGDTVGGTLKEVGKVTGDVGKAAGDVGKAAGDVTKAAGDATKEVGKAADGLLKGVGGLLGGGKKDDAKQTEEKK
jgi:hypothetical protein